MRSLLKGALLNWVSLGIYFISAFILTPVIIKKLGTAGFGTWALIQSFAGYYGLVNLGMGSALLRSITHDLAKQEKNSLQITVSTAVRFFASTGGVILIAALLLGLPAAHFFSIPAEGAHLFALTLFLGAAAIVTDFFSALTTAFLNASERFDWLNGLSVGRQLTQTAGTLLVLWYSPSMAGIAAVMLGTSLIALAISTRLAKLIAPETRFLKKGFHWKRMKELLTYGGSTVFLTVSNIVRLRLGNLIIAKISGVAVVASYSIAVGLVTNLSSVISSAMGVLNPRFTRLNAQSNPEELRRLYRMSLFISSTLALGLGTGLLLFGERFIHFWVGKNLPESVPILKILVIAHMVGLAQFPGWNLMFAVSKHHFMARVSLVEAAANIVLGLWLAQLHGAIGFAWATAGTMLVTKLVIQPIYAARLGSLTLGGYLAPMMIPLISAAVLWSGSCWGGLETALQNRGLMFFCSAAGLYAFTYFGVVALLARHKNYAPPFLGKYLSFPIAAAS